MLLNGVLMVFAAGCVRSVWLILEYVLKSRGVFVRRLLIYAPTSQTRDITREYASHPGLGVKVVGYCGESHEQETLPYLGGQGDVLSAIGREMIDELVVGEMEEGNLELISTIVEVENMGVSVTLVPTVQKIWLGNAYLTHMANHPVLKLSSEEFKGWKRIVKDVEDILLSLCGIVLAAPLMLFCAICVKLDSRGPVFFRQKRMGKNGRFFEMYKFRSMRQDAETELESLASRNEKDGALFKIREDPRITRVGRILRRTSLDELPQLFNVFRGEMSLIGPRPLPLYEVTDDLMEWHRIRQKALPGITGLWQVKGRSDLDFRELEKWDIHYVRNWSLWMDFKILLFTLPAVVRGRGAY